MGKSFTLANNQNDALFELIKSLSKSEKRQFNLYVGRLGGNTDAKFFSLFKFLEKLKTYDERQILENGIVTKQQLSNLKAHLYRQILISLRLNPAHQNIRIQIREQLDFATVLYQKGLYKQSLKLLDKAKSMAIENEEKNIAYEIVVTFANSSSFRAGPVFSNILYNCNDKLDNLLVITFCWLNIFACSESTSALELILLVMYCVSITFSSSTIS